ncbi:MAG: XdhC family protein [Elusimicrobia bacterium]|nr:XdhC family protein [Elusimicrobiota bacterium]
MQEAENVFKLMAEAMSQCRGAALVTVISAAGSTPRECGAEMVVYEDGSSAGTVGGGILEKLAIDAARKALKEGTSRKVSFDLTPKGIGMECVGRVELFIDVHATELKLLVVGAGHVGLKVAEAAALAGIPYTVADDRDEFANKTRFPHAMRILVERPDKAVKLAGVDKKTYVVIVTRCHMLDKECLAAAMKTPAPYIGLIASKNKAPSVFKFLNFKGLHPEKDKRVYAPIGLNCGGKSPGAIAISVLAEILAVHHGRDGRHMRLV